MAQTITKEAHYFDLITTGIGYLNRIREVPVRRGKAFLACDIMALHGASDDVEFTRIDCKVSGEAANDLIRSCQGAIEAQKKVLIAFRIGDLWIDPFIYQKGDKQGEPGASLKGRLLFVSWIKIEGEIAYKAERKQEAPSSPEQSDAGSMESADIEADAPQADAHARQPSNVAALH